MECGFVNLLTVYSDREKELNLDFLSTVYADRDKIRILVEQLLYGRFDRKSVEGKSVLLKPNWVKHCERPSDVLCLCTHEQFILAVLEVILSMHPSKVMLADAPVNTCKWELLLSDIFLSEIESLRNLFKTEIILKDFRRTISDLKTNTIQTGRISMDEYAIFDVGDRSLLEPITTDENRFRITNYNPDEMRNYHSRGKHKYCIARDFFDYDVIITLPKMKTHQKAGFTNALKILIGINGDKDYLPHHRLGALNHGGDCYKDDSFLRRIGEWAEDQKNRNLGGWTYWLYLYMTKIVWRLSRSGPEQTLYASWYGNDTIWRTVMDIQTIAQYGKVNSKGEGVLNDTRQRKVYSISDGIIGGQGDGPLNPEPLPLGVMAFSDNPYLMDVVGGTLMGIDIEKVPLLNYANKIIDMANSEVLLNGNNTDYDHLKAISVNAKMPKGWIKYND